MNFIKDLKDLKDFLIQNGFLSVEFALFYW